MMVCDRCGEPAQHFYVARKPSPTLSISGELLTTVDLCEACVRDYERMIEEFKRSLPRAARSSQA